MTLGETRTIALSFAHATIIWLLKELEFWIYFLWFFQITEEAMVRPVMKLLRLQRFPILQQLYLEERLLRTTTHNWCLINQGTNPPAIVVGISGKPEKLLDVKAVLQDNIPVIRRFSGGGTVIVDTDTVFVTLICRRDAVTLPDLYPRPIMEWTEHLYLPAFQTVRSFHLQEHDYVLGDRKFGGNAQSIIKDRFLHHTSFLWDYQDFRMAYLKLPERAPTYRLARSHSDFICRLKDYMPSREAFADYIMKAFEQQFCLQDISLDEVEKTHLSSVPHITGTRVFTMADLEQSIMPLGVKD